MTPIDHPTNSAKQGGLENVTSLPLRPHALIEVTDEYHNAAGEHDHHCRPQGRAEGEGDHHQDADQQGHDGIVAIEDVEAGHDTILATKAKNTKGPTNIPARKPIPSQRLIRRDRASGLPGMNTATAAGSPEKNTVQPPRTPAQASRPLTTDVPSEGLASQRMWMTAIELMPARLRTTRDETLVCRGGRVLNPLCLRCVPSQSWRVGVLVPLSGTSRRRCNPTNRNPHPAA